ncbi:MAG: rRNA maturation RNase YbeY [Actinomycetota bacterium]
MPSEPPGSPGPEIHVFDRTGAGAVDGDRWAALARTVLIGESVTVGRLDLSFVDRDEMTDLNREHMGGDGPTDVLAFPLDGVDEPDGFADLTGVDEVPELDELIEPLLGDVVVCPDVAAAQAADHVGSVDGELTLLVVHGILHVLGHDHAEPEETDRMQARERVHLEAAGFVHPRWSPAS